MMNDKSLILILPTIPEENSLMGGTCGDKKRAKKC